MATALEWQGLGSRLGALSGILGGTMRLGGSAALWLVEEDLFLLGRVIGKAARTLKPLPS